MRDGTYRDANGRCIHPLTPLGRILTNASAERLAKADLALAKADLALSHRKAHRKVFTGPVRRNTPLINAVRQGRADIVASLIADGHDVNELCGPGRRHGRGVTALYVATWMGFTDVVTNTARCKR